MFYFLVFIAAVTSSISLLEVCTTFQIDQNIAKGKDPNRKKVTCIYAVIIFVIGLPVALDALGSGGAAVKAPFEMLGLTPDSPGFAMWNDCWLDLYDMIAEGVLMPLGAMVMSILIGWVWKINIIKDECELNSNKFRAAGYFNFCFKYVVPVVMVIVLYAQILDFFG